MLPKHLVHFNNTHGQLDSEQSNNAKVQYNDHTNATTTSVTIIFSSIGLTNSFLEIINVSGMQVRYVFVLSLDLDEIHFSSNQKMNI